MNKRSWNVRYSASLFGGRSGGPNEIDRCRRFRGRLNRISADRFCARSVQQDTRPRNAGSRLQEGQPRCLGLRAGTGNASTGIQERKPWCFRLRARSDDGIKHKIEILMSASLRKEPSLPTAPFQFYDRSGLAQLESDHVDGDQMGGRFGGPFASSGRSVA